MGVKSIKSVQQNEQITLNAVFTYQDMIRYKQSDKVQQNYEFLQQIGSGAEGQVYRARCKRTSNIRAIKKIHKYRNQKTLQNLQNQFHILKEIDHPSIVKMYELYQEDINVYIVTELCEGRQLFQMILQDKVIGEEKGFPLFYEVLTSVGFLHRNRIMHRDIKPENIIIGNNRTSVKLIDLGTACKFQNSQLVKRKRIGTVLICFIWQSYYIAPQVLRREYNEKCDVWSLGVILYILLSGGLPFKGQDDLEVLRAVEKGEVEFPVNKWKSVSSGAKQTVKRMLEKDLSKRPSIEQILKFSWIKSMMSKLSFRSVNNEKCINSHLCNMKKFKVHFFITKQLISNPIQDGIFIFIVNFIDNSKHREKELEQTFRALDVNRDGVISIEQLTGGLEKYLKMSRGECAIIAGKIFEKVDVNNSGAIDYSQFVMSASSIEIVVTEQNIDLAFSFIDSDGSGKLSVGQIREKLGTSISEQRYNTLLKEFDKNSDGEISKYEFRDMMKALVKKPSRGEVNINSARLKSESKPVDRNSARSKDVKMLKRTSLVKSGRK